MRRPCPSLEIQEAAASLAWPASAMNAAMALLLRRSLSARPTKTAPTIIFAMARNGAIVCVRQANRHALVAATKKRIHAYAPVPRTALMTACSATASSSAILLGPAITAVIPAANATPIVRRATNWRRYAIPPAQATLNAMTIIPALRINATIAGSASISPPAPPAATRKPVRACATPTVIARTTSCSATDGSIAKMVFASPIHPRAAPSATATCAMKQLERVTARARKMPTATMATFAPLTTATVVHATTIPPAPLAATRTPARAVNFSCRLPDRSCLTRAARALFSKPSSRRIPSLRPAHLWVHAFCRFAAMILFNLLTPL